MMPWSKAKMSREKPCIHQNNIHFLSALLAHWCYLEPQVIRNQKIKEELLTTARLLMRRREEEGEKSKAAAETVLSTNCWSTISMGNSEFKKKNIAGKLDERMTCVYMRKFLSKSVLIMTCAETLACNYVSYFRTVHYSYFVFILIFGTN